MSVSPEAISLPIGINSQEILEQVAKDHMISQAEKYIRERDLFKGTPTVVKFSMLPHELLISDIKYQFFHLMITMNNRGRTVKDVVFEMTISRDDLVLIYLKDLEMKIGTVSYSAHTHDWR